MEWRSWRRGEGWSRVKYVDMFGGKKGPECGGCLLEGGGMCVYLVSCFCLVYGSGYPAWIEGDESFTTRMNQRVCISKQVVAYIWHREFDSVSGYLFIYIE